MKKSFFTRFKDKLNTDYGGRYFEVILQEVIEDELNVLKLLFSLVEAS